MGLSDEERSAVRSLLRGDRHDGSVAARAQMVLWRADGYGVAEIAKMAGVTKPTVHPWLSRYEESGIAGLQSKKPPGRSPQVPGRVRARILALTRQAPPEDTGLSHWSSRAMADYLERGEGISVSHNFISGLWREHDLQPHRIGTFEPSTGPDFKAKVFDVVGLYLNPPEGAVVLSRDEKTQVQALDRTQPMLPVDFGKSQKRTHDYVRHGTTNLFASLNVRTGQVLAECFPRRRTVEFLRFMDRVVQQYPNDQGIHAIVDNLSTHAGDDVGSWLQKHPNVRFHYTPTGSSWLNQIEIWFGIIIRQAIRRGTFVSLAHLIRQIKDYVEYWNEDAKPFEWVATPGQIIARVKILRRDFKKLLANNSK
ncbi:MAG: IS630 family transposase [Actinoallomurus sp.]